MLTSTQPGQFCAHSGHYQVILKPSQQDWHSYLHFTNEKNQAMRSGATCLKSHSRQRKAKEPDPVLSNPKASVIPTAAQTKSSFPDLHRPAHTHQ